MFQAARLIPVAEEVAIERALGRVTSESHFSAITTPNCNVAMKDGIAVSWERIGNKDDHSFEAFETDDFEVVPMGAPVADRYDTLLHAEQCRLTFLKYTPGDEDWKIMAPQYNGANSNGLN